MTKTVALTGATGFIGSHIIENLVENGFQVRALTRSPDKVTHSANVTWIIGTLDNKASLATLVEGADCVVHCAGQVRGKDLATFYRANVEGSLQLLTACEQSQTCKRYLFISSLAARHPNLSWYADSKATAEKELMQQTKTVSLGIFRPTAVYGPRDSELKPVFTWLLRGILPQIGPSSAQLSFLHVYDFSAAIVQWIHANKSNLGPYELCDGLVGGYSWQSLQRIGRLQRHGPVRLIKIPLPLLRGIAALSTLISKLSGNEPMLTQSKIGELTHVDWSVSNRALTDDIGWIPNIQLDRALRDGLF